MVADRVYHWGLGRRRPSARHSEVVNRERDFTMNNVFSPLGRVMAREGIADYVANYTDGSY